MAFDEIRDGDSVHTAVSDLRTDVSAIQDMLTDILARSSAPSASIQSAPIVSSKFPVCLLFVGRAGDVLGARARRADFFHATVFGGGARPRSEASLVCCERLGFRGFRGPLAPFLRSVPPIAGRVAVGAPVPLPRVGTRRYCFSRFFLCPCCSARSRGFSAGVYSSIVFLLFVALGRCSLCLAGFSLFRRLRSSAGLDA